MGEITKTMETSPVTELIQTAGDSPGDETTITTVIYVVDDDPLVGEVVELILQKAGYQPRYYQDPQAALKDFIAANPKPALLLTDFEMGSMNGMELIDRCRRIQPDLKTILLSGTIGEEIAANYTVKPNRFASKPFQNSVLVETIRSLLRDSGVTKESR